MKAETKYKSKHKLTCNYDSQAPYDVLECYYLCRLLNSNEEDIEAKLILSELDSTCGY